MSGRSHNEIYELLGERFEGSLEFIGLAGEGPSTSRDFRLYLKDFGLPGTIGKMVKV
jgi:hypothetical protein